MGRILLVEDDDGVREALVAVLSLRSHEVVPAEEGMRALELLHGGMRPCLILSDLMMPRMDGAELWERVRQDPELRTIPMVIYSARPDVKRRAALLGIRAVLRKPLDLDELVRIADQHCF
jgi:CheY-like chemotaxis protein